MKGKFSVKKYEWLTRELEQEIRKVFEPKYKKKLTHAEIEDIANHLVCFMEDYAKFRWKQENGKQTAR